MRFHDGDERTLRRNAVTLMGPSHFQSSDTLGAFPLTDPDSFSSPAGAAEDISRKRRRLSEESLLNSSLSPTGVVSMSSSDNALVYGRGSTRSPLSHSSETSSHKYRMASRPDGKSHDVVLVNPSPSEDDDEGAAQQPWWPAVVVPAAEVMRDMIGAQDIPEGSLVVRFFEDKLYAIIEQPYIRLMQFETTPFEHFKKMPGFITAKPVVKALEFLRTFEIQPDFKWKTWSSKCDLEARSARAAQLAAGIEDDDDPWKPDPDEERKFMTKLTAFMTLAGAPIKRTPSLAFRDLDLYRLYSIVAGEGGHGEVTSKKRWRNVYASLLRLDDDECPASADKTMRAAYDKYLLQFEIHGDGISGSRSTSGDSAMTSSTIAGISRQSSAAELKQSSSNCSKQSLQFNYGIGMQARCTYKDGNQYAVTIAGREMRSLAAGDSQPYVIHRV